MSVFQPGTRIGKYEIVRVLGAGGMGVVYEARHPVLASRLVIKTLRASLQKSGTKMAERFRNEALAASRLRDDRLPQIFDIDELEDGTQYLVMEFLDGEDLSARLRRGPLAVGYACRLMLEVLEVLAKVHRLGIVHRDIKPANIFLARSDLFGEIPKLLDFGVAHIATMEVTPVGLLLGTPAYMAPEQALGDGLIRPSTDVFSAGVVLFELIAGAGQRPWAKDSAAAYHRALAEKEPPRSLASVARVPPGLGVVIERALARLPADRFADATAFARALEPYADDRAALHRDGGSPRPAGSPHEESPTIGSLATEAPPASDENVETVGTKARRASTSAPAKVLDFTSVPLVTRPIEAAVSGVKVAHLRTAMDRMRQSKLRPALQVASPSSRLQRGERRHVTVVFVDTQLHQVGSAALSSEDLEDLSRQCSEMFAEELEERGAQVQVQPEAGLVAVFGFAEAREDDPERAVTGAFAVHRRRSEAGRALGEVGYALTCRAGIHCGFATRVGGADQQAPNTGDVLSMARRLAEHAPMNGIAGSSELVELLRGAFSTRPAGRVALKGRLSAAVESLEILGLVQRGWEEASGAFTMLGRQTTALGALGSGQMSLSGIGFRSDAPFVGRAVELVHLGELEKQAQAGPHHPTVVHITGPGGVGKTRLVSELLRRLGTTATLPPNILRTQPHTGTTYGLWTALIGALLEHGDRSLSSEEDLPPMIDALCAALAPDRAAQLRIQAPALRLLFGLSGPALDEDESPKAIGQRIETVVQLCLEAAARRAAPEAGDPPLVIAMENLHRADLASLALLGKVLVGIRAPVQPLVFLTGRDAGAPDLSQLPGAAVTIMALAPLDEITVGALATQLGGEPLSDPVRAFVVHRAAGNPLFVEELVHTLRARALLNASAERLRRFTPPTSLYGMLLERVDRLPQALCDVLRLGSVLGVEFERSVFLAVAAEAAVSLGSHATTDPAPPSRPEEALDELSRRGFLDTTVGLDGAALYAFRPAQLQGAIYGTVLSENKRLLHGLAAGAIESICSERLGPHLSRILFHLNQTDDAPRTLEYARAAGQRALGICAYGEAVEDLEIAVALQAQASEESPLSGARTLLDLASSYVWSGKLRLAAARGREAAEAIALALGPREDGAAAAQGTRRELLVLEGRVANVRAQVAYLLPDWEGAVSFREQAERAFSDAGLVVDAAEARCGRGFILRTLGRADLGLQLAQEGWAVLKDSQHLATVAHAGHDLGNVLRDAGLPAASIEIFDRAIAAGEELHRRGNTLESVWGRLAARSGRAMACAMMGRTDEAIADQRAVRELAVRENHPIAHAVSEYHLATHFFEHGDLNEAAALLESSLRMSTEIGMASRALKCRLLQARVFERRGDGETALACLVEAEALARREPLSDDIWMSAVEQLVPALRRSKKLDRAAQLLAEAGLRAEQSGSRQLLQRVEVVAKSDERC